jgi:hypothetical protein
MFVIFIGAMESPMKSAMKWSCAMDLALMQSMRHCFGQISDASTIEQFEKLVELLCSAVEMSRSRCAIQTIPMDDPSTLKDLTAPTSHRLPQPHELDLHSPVHANFGLEVNTWENQCHL